MAGRLPVLLQGGRSFIGYHAQEQAAVGKTQNQRRESRPGTTFLCHLHDPALLRVPKYVFRYQSGYMLVKPANLRGVCRPPGTIEVPHILTDILDAAHEPAVTGDVMDVVHYFVLLF
jgi:hypothetical protein